MFCAKVALITVFMLKIRKLYEMIFNFVGYLNYRHKSMMT